GELGGGTARARCAGACGSRSRRPLTLPRLAADPELAELSVQGRPRRGPPSRLLVLHSGGRRTEQARFPPPADADRHAAGRGHPADDPRPHDPGLEMSGAAHRRMRTRRESTDQRRRFTFAKSISSVPLPSRTAFSMNEPKDSASPSVVLGGCHLIAPACAVAATDRTLEP